MTRDTRRRRVSTRFEIPVAISWRLEDRSSTTVILTPIPGTIFTGFVLNSTTRQNQQENLVGNSVSLDGSGAFNPEPDQGSATFTGQDWATNSLVTQTGPAGGSGFTLSGVLGGQMEGDSADGWYYGGLGIGSGAQSTNPSTGNAAPFGWAVTSPDGIFSGANLTLTFTMTGNDGISNSSENLTGGFTLLLVTNQFTVHLNSPTDPTSGVNVGMGYVVTNTTSNPMALTVLAHDNNPDSSPDGVINYAPGAGDTDGGAYFSEEFSMTVPITAPFVENVQFQSGFNLVVNPGMGPDDVISAQPGFNWSLSAVVSYT